jgi:two-component sensor histidine kinase
MTMAHRTGLRELLGGEYFLERKSLVVLAPYLILTSLGTIFIQSLDGSPLTEQTIEFPWFELLLANLLSILVCWVAIEILNATALRNKAVRPVALGFVLLVSFAIGALKGYTTGVFGLWLGVFQTYEIAAGARWIQGGILGVLSVPLLTLTVAKLHQMNQKRETLIADHVRGLLSGKIAPTKSLQRQVFALKAKSSELLDQVEKSLPQTNAAAGLLFESAVQDLLTNHIRPMSHTIWDEKQRRLPKLTVPMLLRAGIMSPSLNPLISSGLLLVALFMGHVALLPPLDSLQRSLAMAMTTAFLIRAYGFVRLKSAPLYITGYLVTLIGSVALGIALADLLFGVVPTGSFALVWIVTSILALQTILMATIGNQMISADRDMDSEIEALFTDNQIEDRARSAYSTLVNRDYAQFLHSEVQNQLLISALAARQPNFSAEDLKAEIENLRKLFEGLETERPLAENMSLDEVLENLADRWEGFVDLETQLDSQLVGFAFDRSWALIEVLNEAISNSIRHGMASQVVVKVVKLGGVLDISVSDNGIGPTSGKPGLGSRIIEEITGGDWSLSSSPAGGSVLNLQLSA